MKIAVVFLCCFCFGGPGYSVFAQGKEDVRVLRPLEECVLVTDLEDRVDRVEFVPLRDADNGSLRGLRKLLVAPDGRLIILNEKGISCLDPKGKHLYSMAPMCTPEEGCGLIRDICISADAKQILALDRNCAVQCFDLMDGRAVKTIATNSSLTAFHEIAPAINGGFFLYDPIPVDNEKGSAAGHRLLVEFDAKGQEVGHFIPMPDFTIPGFLISQALGNEYFVRVQGGDNACYRICDGVLERVCTIDFGDQGMPSQFMYLQNGGQMGALQGYLKAGYFKMPIYFSETRKDFYFACCGPQAGMYYFLYPREGNSGIRWKGDNNVVIRFFSSDEEYFYALLEEPGLQEYDAHAQDPLLRCVMGKIGLSSGKELEGALLLKIKFK